MNNSKTSNSSAHMNVTNSPNYRFLPRLKPRESLFVNIIYTNKAIQYLDLLNSNNIKHYEVVIVNDIEVSTS